MATARAPICLLANEEAHDLGTSVASVLGVPLTPSRDIWFSCGEGKHVIDANVRGTDLYIFQRPLVPGSDRSVYDRLVMLLHAIDAARYADADRVSVIMPYLPGGRQDKRKGHVREGVSTGLFARMMDAAGVSMVITVEPHNEATVGCFDPRRCVLESLSITMPFAEYLTAEGLVADVVGAPDVGGLERSRNLAQCLQRPLVALSKERDYTQSSVVTRTTLIGEVDGRSVLLVDDIVDTGGSVVSAVQSLWAHGATDVIVAGVHLVLSGAAWERMHGLHAEAQRRGVTFRLVGTSGILHRDPPPWYYAMPLEPLLARVIRSVNSRGSVRALEW